ncbi:hypothetical protein HMSSN139_26140 [Paenibacillus sp. HMSSN-139]|nr:hypothetical protein HMSSN139_26140 [Paenibacillus sp. HMSSN-139]
MAGSERSGVEAASTLLFENAYYVLTPSPDVPEEAYQRLERLLTHTKAQIVRVDPVMHDEIVGAISHLPHIIAVALVNQVRDYNDGNGLYRMLAAGGFRDITRIASSDPVIWRDILLSNREVLLGLLKDWNREIDGFISLLEDQNGEGIEASFQKRTSSAASCRSGVKVRSPRCSTSTSTYRTRRGSSDKSRPNWVFATST